ncbi:MAG TPA: hypothetical protein VGO50_02370 [Pyrinomonadaceae bacterium]|jgi:DNA-directed RNA polymerase specialized sigma24 family protein|nr:hypothetical protein [Pyrinomonadaceae bacterium]
MTKEVTKEHFDTLLRWLDPNPEIAGQKFEKIRASLIQVFLVRGCCDAEELTDETIDRVAQKSPRLIESYVGQPVLYFYGVAHRVYLEWLRKEKKKKELLVFNSYQSNGIESKEDDDDDLAFTCLESCLENLTVVQRKLVLDYYREEAGYAKIEYRKVLSAKLGITVNALHIKIFRIRASLEKCVTNCVVAKSN